MTLEGLIGKGVSVYTDDIVIYVKTLEQHEEIFDKVMGRLRDANWKLEPSKCEILRQEVTYLGHIIRTKRLHPDPKKIEAVENFPRPKNVKNIRKFLGLAGYHRRFIKDLAKIAKPLIRLLQKNEPFEWTDEAEASFQNLI